MGAPRLTEAKITRAVKAAEACGLVVAGLKIGADGSIEIRCQVDKASESPQPREPKQW